MEHFYSQGHFAAKASNGINVNRTSLIAEYFQKWFEDTLSDNQNLAGDWWGYPRGSVLINHCKNAICLNEVTLQPLSWTQ